jgi:H+/Cl- antiporter ClcA
MAATVASLTGDQVVHALGHHHGEWPTLHPGVDLGLLGRALVLAVVFALTGRWFVTAVDRTRTVLARLVPAPIVRPALVGVATVALALLVGREFLGLSLPLLDAALAGSHESFTVPLLKAMFTVVALGSGFPGGEVTPLFVIGSTLGAALAAPLDMAPAVAAALGMVAVFAAASGAPLASAAMAGELFGPGLGVYALVICALAAALNRRQRLYPADDSAQAVANTRMGSWRGPRI